MPVEDPYVFSDRFSKSLYAFRSQRISLEKIVQIGVRFRILWCDKRDCKGKMIVK